MFELTRRGHKLGNAPSENTPQTRTNKSAWQAGYVSLLPAVCHDQIPLNFDSIQQSETLVQAILNEEQCDQILDHAPYRSRLEPMFENLGSAINEGDDQEIETVLFDAMDDENCIAEDLWMKVSWLSFHDEDASLRFRFSFGIDLAEDVAADPHRQEYAAKLADAVFPESTIITDNPTLLRKLEEIVDSPSIRFVERIVYFNAPSGGAYLHHDLERGHAGVVYAQLTGHTYWLALPRSALIDEIIAFVDANSLPSSISSEMRTELILLVKQPIRLAQELDSFANSSLIHLINETQGFVQHLLARGFGTHVAPGDVLLLPQTNVESCCWHSVFCVGDEMGQALSFAIRVDN
ncbi:hypothetical protein [Arenicella xantha]|uniref:Uncharacterized protein n=1 Tax=Arenicella xantha TaxID=644221 RepID=A0A395JM25_9GAMM|nr:hypothetical protein [Arenicella xantha]RBP52691.1 hypothetical protein DFR28_10173 [Arenicella xantha]